MVLKAPGLPAGRNGGGDDGNDICAVKTVLVGGRDAESPRNNARWSRTR